MQHQFIIPLTALHICARVLRIDWENQLFLMRGTSDGGQMEGGTPIAFKANCIVPELMAAKARAPPPRVFSCVMVAPIARNNCTMSVKPAADAKRNGVLLCWSQASMSARRSISTSAILHVASECTQAPLTMCSNGVKPRTYPVLPMVSNSHGQSRASSNAALQIRHDQQ